MLPPVPTFRAVLVRGAKILIVGEAPGENEVRQGTPFVGAAGRELDSMLEEVGLRRYQVSLTNVFFDRPPDNNLAAWCVPKKEGLKLVDPGRPFVEMRGVKGILDPRRVQPALERLYGEILSASPNIIVPMGNTALQAICGLHGITQQRGVVHEALLGGRTFKVLPTFHPAVVLRTYSYRPVVIADLYKVLRESETAEIHMTPRRVFVDPTLEDLVEWEQELCSAEYLAFDIETALGQITCIGFAPTIDTAYVVPFWFGSTNYWQNDQDEVAALQMVRRVMESPAVKVAQNGMYDTAYLLRYGIAPRNFLHDTMLLHHGLYPALPKSLGFIGSIHCNERAWKQWRKRAKDDLKRDD